MKANGKTAAVAIIPVRVESQRLPGKALLAESGQALFLHSCQQARAADCFEEVLVASDSQEVLELADGAGFRAVRTSDRPRSGSERCAEAARALRLEAEVIVNIQGDWPEIEPRDLQRLVQGLGHEAVSCATLVTGLSDPAKLADPNVVKVVRRRDGLALYFSRAAIPFHRRPDQEPIHLRHIGVYGFRRQALLRIQDLPSSGLDEREGLEQLRFLENGMRILVLDAQGDPWGIEDRSDYDAFLERLARKAARGPS